MRVLKFIVEGNTITLDPTCDFSGLFPGREEHAQAEFTRSKINTNVFNPAVYPDKWEKA